MIRAYITGFIFTKILLKVLSDPQLNISPLPEQGKPYDYINNHSPDFDENRSQRFGPPYQDHEDEIINDHRQNNEEYTDPYYIKNFVNLPYNNSYKVKSNDGGYKPFNEDRHYSIQLEKIRNLVLEADRISATECNANVQAQWDYETNINGLTEAEALLAQHRYSDFQRTLYNQLKTINTTFIYDESLNRQIKRLLLVGSNALPPDILDRYNRLINNMLTIYNEASICAYQQPFHCGLRLQTDIKNIIAHSRDWDELQYVWTEWHRKSGNLRDMYEQLIEIIDEITISNNFKNADDYWFAEYESTDFRYEIESVWEEIKPLYELIHAYVRRKLREFYGPEKINRNAPLPSHIFGNIYGQTWINILDILLPYPGKNFVDVTPSMVEQGYTPLIMARIAEEFFLSINMSALPQEFWLNSIFDDSATTSSTCTPSAWDFCDRHDFRIKLCSQVKHKDLITMHHEISHIQYFLNYRHLPKAFREGANPGFHEAIGDAITLSVSTLKHLQTLGLSQKSTDDTTYDINMLFATAIDKVVFLPFALALDTWRADVFSHRISKDQMNCHYWILREQISGIKPPVLRTEMDFDPGAKYHIPANVPYMKYYFGTVLQFQIYRAMCLASKQYDPEDSRKPLHKCDIYRQPEAGAILKKIMEQGASKSWQEILFESIGESRLDGSAIRDYFQPLEIWLRNENLRNQETLGWSYDGDYCKYSIETANLQVYGGFYNSARSLQLSLSILLIFILLL